VLLGIRAGVGALFVGCLIEFVMISNMSGVFQGSFASAFSGPQQGYMGPSAAAVGHEYLLLRLHTDGGDLVLLHAVGVHGMVLLTLPALMLARSGLAERRRLLLMASMAGLVVVGLLGLTAQAFGQRPWDSLPVLAVVGLGSLTVGYLVTLTHGVLLTRAASVGEAVHR
jgi:hypothetical protein